MRCGVQSNVVFLIFRFADSIVGLSCVGKSILVYLWRIRYDFSRVLRQSLAGDVVRDGDGRMPCGVVFDCLQRGYFGLGIR